MTIPVVSGAAILLLLGLAHALYTLQSSPDRGPMTPTEPSVRVAMRTPGGLGLAPDIDSSLWTAWVGFNLSHALGVIVIALAIAVPAINDLDAAAANLAWLGLALAVPPIYLLISLRYWFRAPTAGITLGIVLITSGVVGTWLT